MATTDLIDGVVGLSMYSTLLVITIAAYVWTGFRTGSCFRVSVQTVFHCFLFSFLCGTAHLPNRPFAPPRLFIINLIFLKKRRGEHVDLITVSDEIGFIYD
jgi:hypothetical protein